MGLHYLTFMGENLDNRKRLTFVRTMNSVNCVNNVRIFNNNVVVNSVLVNSTYREE